MRSSTFLLRVSVSTLLAAQVPITTFAAGANPSFTLPLHYQTATSSPCSGYLPVDCLNERPTTVATPGQPAAIFIFAHNISAVSLNVAKTQAVVRA
jgi:hypothetical protein